MDTAPSGNEDLTVLLGMAFRAVVDELHSRLAALGYDDIRPAHGFAFKRLVPDGATGNELAEYLGITKQATSQMIDYLEQQGYVVRRPDPRDGRQRLVVLTSRGWACVQAGEDIRTAFEQDWTGRLGADRMAALRADLDRLAGPTAGSALPRRLRPVW